MSLRKYPAKSLEHIIPISEKTREIILQHSGKNCKYSNQLPDHLDLDYSNIDDVSALGSVKYLSLRGCTKVTDVSALGNVEGINLQDCTGITDVSALGNVLVLNLQGCTGITDVSMLGKIQYLNLQGCTRITDFSNITHKSVLL